MEVLKTTDLKKIYQAPSGEVRALDGVNIYSGRGICGDHRLFWKRQDDAAQYAGRPGLSHQR